MSLRKIEVYGFKSFADRLEMKFNDGITAIVGPNGCGKSNVSDAVRWVLGEQSPSKLRGKSMQDVIFGGTDNRKSMSYCEVSMFFDNTKKMFPLDFSEVVISRKLYRNGESEYLINKETSRLKDISDLLREVGLGRDGYSIVGQGRIDAILNAKPDDRRGIFEEAIGISKFRVRKEEAERKLLRTKDNMNRLNDILSELNRQINPLRNQSENAKKYLELYEQLKTNEINNFIYSYDNAAAAKSVINDKIRLIDDQCSNANKLYMKANADYERLKYEIGSIDSAMEEIYNHQTELLLNNERQSSAVQLNSERLKMLQNQNQDFINEVETAQKKISSLIDEKNSIQNDALTMVGILDEVTIKLGESNDNLAIVAEQLVINQGNTEQNQSEVLTVLDGLSNFKSRSTEISTLQMSLNERLVQLEKLIEDNNQELVSTNENGKSFLTQSNEQISAIKQVEEEVSKLNRSILQDDEQINSINNLLSDNKQLLTADESRFRTLKQIIDNFEAFGTSVKLLMQDASRDSNLGQKVLGVVGNIISVSPKYELAIDVALGAATQNIVTKNEEDSKYLISHLKNKRYGRVTFLPLTSIKSRKLDSNSILSEKGCLGVASEIVQFDSKFSVVISSLLGSTVIVEDLDTAVALSRKYGYSHRIVTLEGDIIAPQGSITGGSRKADSNNVLSYANQQDKLNDDIENRKVFISQVYKKLDTAKLDRATNLDKLNRQNMKLVALQIDNSKISEKANAIRQVINGLNNSINGYKKEQQEIRTRISDLSQNLAQADSEINSLNDKKTTIHSSTSKVQQQYVLLKVRRDTLQEEITDYKLKMVNLQTNLANSQRQVNALNTQIEQTQLSYDEKKSRIESNDREIKNINSSLAQTDLYTINMQKIEQVENNLQEVKNRKISILTESEEKDNLRTQYLNDVTLYNNEKMKEQFNLEKIDIDIDTIQRKVEEDYNLNYSSAMKYKLEVFDLDESKKAINKLRNSISQLGNININAIEEYAEVSSRYTDIETQYADLVKAEENLNVVIDDLTRDMMLKFNDGFEVINRNFGIVFKELFAGGHARLTIERGEDKDPLDFGIEIEAQPPGKSLKSISLLSGGERALTAVAILFAILKLRPMPFCVLDEIEAALDDANADRTAQYLRKFSKDTQFIVITHKKPTMERADVLYGVTMEEKGISKIVSVQLTEAVKHSLD